MKATTYTIILSDSREVRVKARTASDAIQMALVENLGRKVSRCRSGLNEAEAREKRLHGFQAMAGEIFYEIPNHEALTEAPAKRSLRRTDDTVKFPFYDEVKNK